MEGNGKSVPPGVWHPGRETVPDSPAAAIGAHSISAPAAIAHPIEHLHPGPQPAPILFESSAPRAVPHPAATCKRMTDVKRDADCFRGLPWKAGGMCRWLARNTECQEHWCEQRHTSPFPCIIPPVPSLPACAVLKCVQWMLHSGRQTSDITPVVPWCRPSGLTRPPVDTADPASVRDRLCRLHLKPAL